MLGKRKNDDDYIGVENTNPWEIAAFIMLIIFAALVAASFAGCNQTQRETLLDLAEDNAEPACHIACDLAGAKAGEQKCDSTMGLIPGGGFVAPLCHALCDAIPEPGTWGACVKNAETCEQMEACSQHYGAYR